MDRLKLNTKALLGMATRTVDQEHEMKHMCVRTLNHAVTQYEVAMSKLSVCITALASAMHGVEKAYKEVVVNEKQLSLCDGMKETTSFMESLRLNALTDLSEALKASGAPALSPLKKECDACDKIHIERSKAVDLYDYNRDVVEKKEVQYAAKGKPLDVSKNYKEEVSKRDASKEEYLAKNAEYNKSYDQLVVRKSELTLSSLKVYVHFLSDFSKKLDGEVAKMCETVDKIAFDTNENERDERINVEEENQKITEEESTHGLEENESNHQSSSEIHAEVENKHSENVDPNATVVDSEVEVQKSTASVQEEGA